VKVSRPARNQGLYRSDPGLYKIFLEAEKSIRIRRFF
jgi:hypothetical protein